MDIGILGLFHAVAGIVLLVLGLLALTARKSRLSRHPNVGEAYFWLLTVTLTTGMIVGLSNPGITLFEIVTPPTWLLGLLGYLMVKRKPDNWLRWHISGMGGSYIGAVTAASFQVFPRVLPDHLALTTAYWLLPTIVGSILIARTTAKWMKQSAHTRTTRRSSTSIRAGSDELTTP